MQILERAFFRVRLCVLRPDYAALNPRERVNLAENTLSDKELLSQFRAVEQMPEEEKSVVKKVIDALITKSKLRKLAV